MSQPTSMPTDLILQLLGGQRDGELISIHSEKCLLGSEESGEQSGGASRCAIFRGPQGAALRSYCDGILVNGEFKTTHWLVEGDRIEFPNSISVEVQQIGCLPADSTRSVEREVRESEEMNTDTTSQNPQLDAPLACSLDMNTHQESVLETRECEIQHQQESQRLTELEFQVSEIRQWNEKVDDRFGDLEDRMNKLTDTISQLVDLASAGTVPAPVEARKSAETIADFPSLADSPSTEPERSVESGHQVDNSIASEWDRIESMGSTQIEIAESPIQETVAEPITETVQELVTEPVQELVADPVQELVADPVQETIAEPPVQEFEMALEAESQTDLAAPAQQEEESSDRQNETVADVLERMKAEGQWGGIPEEDEVEPVIAEAVVEPEAQNVTAAEPRNEEDSDEADVEDYMSQLLSRMRGGAPSQPVAKQEKKTEPKPAPAQPKPQTPAKLLKPEEFVPRQKAAKIESLGAMRELANSTARSAVKSSEASRRKALAYVQLGIAVAALAMSGYYFGVQCQSFFDVGFMIGLVCLGVTGFLGYRFYNSMSSLKVDDALETDAPNARNKKEEPAEPAVH